MPFMLPVFSEFFKSIPKKQRFVQHAGANMPHADSFCKVIRNFIITSCIFSVKPAQGYSFNLGLDNPHMFVYTNNVGMFCRPNARRKEVLP